MNSLNKEEGMNGTPDQFISEETVSMKITEFGVNVNNFVITCPIMSSN